MQDKFSKYVYDDRCTYKHAKGTSADPAREFHNYHEILLFVGGKTTFLSEEKRIPLSPYQTVIIPKETYHQFINVTDEEYHRCVFSFDDIPEFEDLIKRCMHSTHVIEASPEQRIWFRKMNETVDSDCSEKEKQVLMHALLALVLSEVSREHQDVKEGSKPSEITSKSIELINENLCNRISIPELSRRLNVSVSTLTQTFKRDMNISVYQYILRKKLIMAQQKIQDGESATTAAMLCGFNDYSSFYKQYKKMFGTLPSERTTRFDGQ
ncbi:MAG: helix-turn-helix domain-containing protein [Clostridia bacterium]|nr:helix-turn-helix domain-containing protein [Clostridia bacterium]